MVPTSIRSPILLLALALVASAQTQTLPGGYEAVPGNASTNWPQNVANDQIWQWHYDSSEFNLQAPLTITEIAIRPRPGFLINAFNFPDWRVTLMEAKTDYRSGNRATVLADNILRSKVVRTGPWTGGPFIPLPGATVGGFASMGLTGSFTYDPSTGNDFIVQIEKCGTTLAWGTQADAVSGAIGAEGGNRYGDTSDCAATSDTASLAADVVPIIRISYHAATQTLPRGFDTVDGNGSSGFPVTTLSDQKWQWHYDSSEFDVQGPIAIRDIAVRASSPAAALAAFQFSEFKVTLGPASTDYTFPAHDPEFADNIEGQKVVRTGRWSGGPVGPSAGTVARWVPLGIRGFVYDPSSGQDFIVQIEKCGPTTPWSATLDAVVASPGTGGGHRYGHTSSCTALAYDSASATIDFVPIIRVTYEPLTRCRGAVTVYPYREDFDSLPTGTSPPQGWLNLEGEAPIGSGDWLVSDTATPSLGTGPDGDHTTGTTNFMYVEDSLTDDPVIALMTPCFDLTGLTSPRMSFWVHSLSATGATQSSLSVNAYVMPNGPFIENVVPAIGHLGPSWVDQTIDLSPFAGGQVRIQLEVNNDNGGFRHDIAVDDVRVYEPTFQGGQAPTIFASLDAAGALEPNGLPLTLGVPGPYFAPIFYGENLGLAVSGAPNQPFVLFTGTLDVGAVAFPGVGQLDVTDPGSFVIIDGVGGTGAVPGMFDTGASGSIVFNAPSTLPPGLMVPLQAAVFTGGPGVVALSNALVIESL